MVQAEAVESRLAKLEGRIRVHGAMVLFFSTLIGAFGILLLVNRERYEVQAIWLIVLSAFGVVTGLVKLLVLPTCMRKPERIERIELFGPGDVHHIHVILDDGRVNKLLVDKADREAVKAALLQRRNEIVLRARVVQR